MRSLPFLISSAAFERGHCYEPYIQNGNFSSSDPSYAVGAVVQFSCDLGHSLEQGPPVIECINARDPYWNDTEPLCKGNGALQTRWRLRCYCRSDSRVYIQVSSNIAKRNCKSVK